MDASPVTSGADVSREEFRELTAEVCNLRRRVTDLEVAALRIASPHLEAAALPTPVLPEVHVSNDLVPSIGRILLALAGGYLLRALTDLGVWPRAAGVACGIAYAAAWLAIARRTPATRKVRAAAHSTICALILAPLIWEAATRMELLGSWAAALLLVGFAAASLDAIVTSACAATAIALLIARHDLLPFTAALLAIALLQEGAALAGHTRRGRWVAAGLADIAVLAFTLLMRGGTLPEGYVLAPQAALAAVQIALAAIFGVSIAMGRFRNLDVAQAALAWAIGLGGLWYSGRPILSGAIALAAAMACYAAVLVRHRKAVTYSVCALLLMSGGTAALLPARWAVLCWCALAIVVTLKPALAWQGPLYLWIAMLFSGVAGRVYSQLFSSGTVELTTAATLLVTSVIAYALAADWRLRLPIAAAIAWTAAGLIARAVPIGSAGTIAMVVFAALAAWAANRWARRDLVWLAYGLMAVAASRLLLCDFGGNNTALVVSLVLYGGALLVLPRLLRKPS